MLEEILGRKKSLFEADFSYSEKKIIDILKLSNVMVIGGAGTIGSAVVKILVKLKAKKIIVVDISENNLVELIRDIRSSKQKIDTELETFAIDSASKEFLKLFANQINIDYILNFSALKHVRSERNIYTLKRLIDVNIVNSINLLKLAEQKNCRKYFCVSTDKATNPINMMGASKQLMEKLIFSNNSSISVTTARFANVLFSDGSLLHGFENRLKKKTTNCCP